MSGKRLFDAQAEAIRGGVELDTCRTAGKPCIKCRRESLGKPETAQVLPQYSALEQEVAILYAVWQMIDGMVNYQNFVKFDPPVTSAMIESSVHQRLFNILLVDFLSKPESRKKGDVMPFGLQSPPSIGRPTDSTYLLYLRQVCAAPQLGKDVSALEKATNAFADWLEADAFVPDVWLYPLGKPVNLMVERMTFIKICGNICKHNFSRLQYDARKIQTLLRKNGRSIREERIYELLPQFQEWFHDNVLNYHVGTLAEFLNNIRWAIYRYLQPHLRKSFVPKGGNLPGYRFKVPRTIRRAAPLGLYWDLMNKALEKPYFTEFAVDPIMKLRY
ncbi:hypothetical protein [Mesorhizobium sp. M1378]|uniref:hypothetical protein n=1 Tax=Mesorhizobium sp. M1378 TaxID=2957092 RepID=UPI003337DE25